MKKLISITALLFICIFSTLADNEVGNNIQNAITAQLKIPAEILKQNFEKVNVEFSIKRNGALTAVNVDTPNLELKKIINEKFPLMDLSKIPDLSPGTYKIDIYFQML